MVARRWYPGGVRIGVGLGVVLIAACSGGKAERTRYDAAVVTASDAAAHVQMVTISDRGDAKALGPFEIELRSTGGGSGPGQSMATYRLFVRHAGAEQTFGLTAAVGGMFGDRDLDAELVVFDRLIVIDDDRRGTLTATLMPGPVPTPLEPDAALAMIEAEARRTGRPLGDLNRRFRTASPGNLGVVVRPVRDGRVIWTGQVGVYTRRLEIVDARPDDVYPEVPRGAVGFGEADEVKLPGGFRATLRSEMGRAPGLSIRKGKATQELGLNRVGPAELVAFGKVFALDEVHGELVIWVVPGSAPEPIDRDAALARIEPVARASGWPMDRWPPDSDGLIGDQGLGVIHSERGWVARVGQYTGRVWITNAPAPGPEAAPAAMTPPRLENGVTLVANETISLPDGFGITVALSAGSGHHRSGKMSGFVTITRGAEQQLRQVHGDVPLDVELVAFDRVFVIGGGKVHVLPGGAPAEVTDDEARRLIEDAAAKAGRPASTLLGRMDHPPPGFVDLLYDDWIGRVGVYTRRVWILAP